MYWEITNEEQSIFMANALPDMLQEFNQLIDNQLNALLDGETGSVLDDWQWEEWRHQRIFKLWENRDSASDVFFKSFGYKPDEQYQAASPEFKTEFGISFRPSPFVSGDTVRKIMGYLTVYTSVKWWQANRAKFETWWLAWLQKTQSEQAYTGISYILPLNFNYQGYILPFYSKLTNAFYGLDMNDAFEMSAANDSPHMHLTGSMKTPTFGVLVCKQHLEKIGGKQVIETILKNDNRFRLIPVSNGYWIEAGDQPSLYPREKGRPETLVKLYHLLKPALLEYLWVMGEQKGSIEEGVMQANDSKNWLKRFE